ncbi:hypothetical protein [Ureibacillus sinduriensis]|uniref:Lipoprotein n=1 Tax=Ureibacillus sinduriensis BLB-1 = JCM 15800 TaxID=1384057 RepID=A0A0A3HV97_9BACL|nr:hypothetical protein [Ureibacillus sinduriensis]KGR75160.1 hypothetical protein CD33_12875 [Ureibacillus sinduriensis BLB-1 = JCM 15800]
MKKFMKSIVPVSALLLMLTGCAEDEEDVDVDVNEEEPAVTDDEADVNIIDEDGANTETNTEPNTETDIDDTTIDSTGGQGGASDNTTVEGPTTDTDDGETNE